MLQKLGRLNDVLVTDVRAQRGTGILPVLCTVSRIGAGSLRLIWTKNGQDGRTTLPRSRPAFVQAGWLASLGLFRIPPGRRIRCQHTTEFLAALRFTPEMSSVLFRRFDT